MTTLSEILEKFAVIIISQTMHDNDAINKTETAIKQFYLDKLPESSQWNPKQMKQFSTDLGNGIAYQAGYNQAINDFRKAINES